MKFKRFGALLVSAVLCIGMAAPAFAYEGDTTTHMFSTRAFILEVVEKGLKKSGFASCKIMFQVGENPMEAYLFSQKNDTFEQVAI